MFKIESSGSAPPQLERLGDVGVTIDIDLSGRDGGGESLWPHVVLFSVVLIAGLTFFSYNGVPR
jgi:hypothetical protein